MKKYSWGIILILFASFQVIGGLINLGVVGTDNNLFEKILPILFGGALMFLGIMLYRSPESKCQQRISVFQAAAVHTAEAFCQADTG